MASDIVEPAARPQTAGVKAAPHLPRSALLLVGVGGFALIDALSGWHPAAYLAVPLLIAYFAAEWHRLAINARVMLAACAVLAVPLALHPDAPAILALAASRMTYLPALLIMLGLLRAAASASAIIASAGRHLVSQPPSRRYVALAFGGHTFGILFNLGGLALLIDMTRRANTLEAAGGNPLVVAWRERRMTTAILRGFACIVFWSPLGVALNMLLTAIPGVSWPEVAPYGITAAVAFAGLGWMFDHFQRPPPLTLTPPPREPRGTAAVLAVIAHVVAISALTGAADVVLRLPFQTALLVMVPLYSALWVLAVQLANATPAPLAASLGVLKRQGVARFPLYANEMAVFAASGFFSVAVVALIPREALQAFFTHLMLPPNVLAVFLMLSVAAMALIGMSPLISVSILASVVSAAQIPGLSPLELALVLAAGWTATVVIAPLNPSIVMVAGLVNRPPAEVSLKWNGPFAVAVLLTASALILVLV